MDQKRKEIHVVAGVFTKDDKVLIMRRRKEIRMGGFWEFPGGKIEVNETHEQALKRELDEELQLSIDVHGFICKVIHDYPDFRIHLYAYHVNSDRVPTISSDHDRFEWICPEEVNMYPIAEADIPILQKLKK